jgi:hypothetical protein
VSAGYEDEDEDDGYEDREQSYLPPGGRPRLLSEQCATCVYRPGNPMQLRRGRLKQMTQAGIAGGGVTCHDTLTYGAHPDFGPALCRGFYDNYGHQTNLIRIYERLGGFDEVDPPEKEDE